MGMWALPALRFVVWGMWTLSTLRVVVWGCLTFKNCY